MESWRGFMETAFLRMTLRSFVVTSSTALKKAQTMLRSRQFELIMICLTPNGIMIMSLLWQTSPVCQGFRGLWLNTLLDSSSGRWHDRSTAKSAAKQCLSSPKAALWSLWISKTKVALWELQGMFWKFALQLNFAFSESARLAEALHLSQKNSCQLWQQLCLRWCMKNTSSAFKTWTSILWIAVLPAITDWCLSEESQLAMENSVSITLESWLMKRWKIKKSESILASWSSSNTNNAEGVYCSSLENTIQTLRCSSTSTMLINLYDALQPPQNSSTSTKLFNLYSVL